VVRNAPTQDNSVMGASPPPSPKGLGTRLKTVLLACCTKTTVIAIWNAPVGNPLTWCRKFTDFIENIVILRAKPIVCQELQGMDPKARVLRSP